MAVSHAIGCLETYATDPATSAHCVLGLIITTSYCGSSYRHLLFLNLNPNESSTAGRSLVRFCIGRSQATCQHVTEASNHRMVALIYLFSSLYVLLSKKTPVTHIS